MVDVAGHTILPGLIDMHGHLFANLAGNMSMQLRPFARLYLAGGVTTVFSAGDEDPEATIAFREQQRAGAESGTRIYLAGPYFTHDVGQNDTMLHLTGPDSARAHFREWEERIDGVKVYTDITAEEFAALVAEADEAGLTVTGHLGSLTATQAIELGIDRLEHGIFAMSEFGRPNPANPFDLEFLDGLATIDFETGTGAALIDKIVSSGTVLDPTVVILEALFEGPLVLAEDWERYLAPETAQRVRAMNQALEGMRNSAAPDRAEYDVVVGALLDKQRELVRRVHEAGGLVVGGTDPVFVEVLPGYGMHREVEHFVQAGMSPLEAIRACTLNAARSIGLDDELGSVAVGKLADLIVVEGDVASDVGAVGNTRMVFQAGARFSPGELRESVVGTIE